jgi:hypothetical protein
MSNIEFRSNEEKINSIKSAGAYYNKPLLRHSTSILRRTSKDEFLVRYSIFALILGEL